MRLFYLFKEAPQFTNLKCVLFFLFPSPCGSSPRWNYSCPWTALAQAKPATVLNAKLSFGAEIVSSNYRALERMEARLIFGTRNEISSDSLSSRVLVGTAGFFKVGRFYAL